MSRSVRILLADNQPLIAAGLHHFIATREDASIVGEVDRADLLEDMVKKHKPDLLIADYNLPNFINKTHLQAVKDVSPETNVLILSSDNNKSSILDILQIGVKGYVTKECSREEVMMAIQSTARGEKFFCHKILDIIMEKHFNPEPENCDPAILTVRETEILKLIAHGNSTQAIADELHLSPHTVQTHRKSIIRKLNIKSPTEFVIYAIDLGLLKPR